MSDLLPVDDQPTLVGAEPLYAPPSDPLTATSLGSSDAPSVAAPSTMSSDARSVAASVPALVTSEILTCPECGASQRVSMNRRDAEDFCQHCDYPLFWTPNRVLRDLESAANAESLRRLPGTVGRATVASLACPHCAEPNAVTAQTCVRCGLSMHPVAEPPPPAPAYVPPPPPPVYAEPQPGVAWWVWAVVAIAFVATVTLIVLVLTNTIG